MPDAPADYEIEWDDDEIPEKLPALVPPPAPSFVAPAISAADDRSLADVQAAGARAAAREADPGGEVAGEVVESGDKVELLGKSFRIAERIGLMPLLKFASAADVDTEDPRALSAMYSLLRDCIYAGTPGCGECAECLAKRDQNCKLYEKGDWGAFEEHAMVTKADADDLMEVVQKVLEVVSGRPTQPRAGTSPGRRGTRGGSTARGSGTSRKGSRR